MKDFETLVKSRQSSRGYLPKPIARETLEKIASVSLNAPSACNSQPWKVYIASGEKRGEVAKSLQDLGMNKFASEAAAFFVVTEKSATLKPGAERKFSRDHFVKYDIGEFVAYLTLAAKDLGVDTCILGWVNGKTLREAVGYPMDEECSIVVAAGYSDTPLREKSRKPFEEAVCFID